MTESVSDRRRRAATILHR